jgi:hypothetical protein
VIITYNSKSKESHSKTSEGTTSTEEVKEAGGKEPHEIK